MKQYKIESQHVQTQGESVPDPKNFNLTWLHFVINLKFKMVKKMLMLIIFRN